MAPGRRWAPRSKADRAIAAALPLILTAEQVTVLIGDEGGVGDARLEDQLSRAEAAGIPVVVTWFGLDGRTIGAALLAEAHKAGADLLVMGAFTRSRFSEFVLGGATREILADADLPVLMRH